MIYDVIIVGAGIAGLSCAHHLSGKNLLVLEKSRGAGGRAATRYWKNTTETNATDTIEARIDHGAQYFTVRQPAFLTQAEQWLKDGVITKWADSFHRWQDGVLTPPNSMGHPRFVAPLGMNQLAKKLAENTNINYQQKVVTLIQKNAIWQVSTEDGQHHQAKHVVLTMPAPQVLQLLDRSTFTSEYPERYRAELESVTMNPCFALMLEVAQAPKWQGITCHHPVISWIAYDSSKRATADKHIVLVHAQRDYSRDNVDKNKESVAEEVLESLLTIDPTLQPTSRYQIHRWLYAQATSPYPQPFINFSNGLFACGDWCGGNKLEDAFISGVTLANFLEKNH